MTVSVWVPIAIFLAVLAAGCFAVASVLQHRELSAARTGGAGGRAGSDAGSNAGSDTGSGLIGWAGLRAMMTRPRWLAGLGLAVGGAALHAVALVLAPVSIVQPVGVLAVPFAVLVATRVAGVRPGRGVLVGVALATAGVAGFVLVAAGPLVAGTAAGSVVVPASHVALAGAGVAVLVLGLAAGGLTSGGRTRCVAFACAGAVAFGLVSVLLRATALALAGAGPLPDGLLDPEVLGPVAGSVGGILVALLVGGWFVQQAFASGPPAVVVSCLTVVDPIVAVALGVVLLGESRPDVGTGLLLGFCGAVAAAGVVALARHHPDVLGRAEPTPAPPPTSAPTPSPSPTPTSTPASAQPPTPALPPTRPGPPGPAEPTPVR